MIFRYFSLLLLSILVCAAGFGAASLSNESMREASENHVPAAEGLSTRTDEIEDTEIVICYVYYDLDGNILYESDEFIGTFSDSDIEKLGRELANVYVLDKL